MLWGSIFKNERMTKWSGTKPHVTESTEMSADSCMLHIIVLNSYTEAQLDLVNCEQAQTKEKVRLKFI